MCIRDRYFALLDTPDKLWQAPDAIQELIDRLYRKVAGETYPPVGAQLLTQLQTRGKQLDDALAAEERAEAGMTCLLYTSRCV